MPKNLSKSAALIADYKQTFESDHGRRVLKDLMRKYCILTSTFVPGDSYSFAFNEGTRCVVLSILSRLKINIDRYVKNLEEMNKQNDNEENF